MPKFELGQTVKITASGKTGQVIRRAANPEGKPMLLIRYLSADGAEIEGWWDKTAIEAA